MKEKRFKDIVDVVNRMGIVSYADLSEMFHVSGVTIRRDLSELEGLGLLTRIHGGAKALDSNNHLDLPDSIRATVHPEEKQRIAHYALQMIQPGEAVILDSSSTNRELAKLLVKGRDPITVITNDVQIACTLTINPNVELIIVGGKVRSGHYSAIGMFSSLFWQQLHANKIFLGVDTVNIAEGLFNHNAEEIEGKRLMLNCAEQKIALADYSKFSSTSVMKICPIQEIDYIITNKELPDEVLEGYAEKEKIIRV